MNPVPIAPNLHRHSAPSTTSAKLVIRTSKNWVLPPRPRPNRRNTIHNGVLPTPALTPSSSNTGVCIKAKSNSISAKSSSNVVKNVAKSTTVKTGTPSSRTTVKPVANTTKTTEIKQNATATTTPHVKRKRENSIPVNLKKAKKEEKKPRDLSNTSVENCLAFLKFDDEDTSTTNNTDIDDDLFSLNSPLSSTTCTPMMSSSSIESTGKKIRNNTSNKKNKAIDNKKFINNISGINVEEDNDITKPQFFTINNITSATTTAPGSISPLDDPITTTEELSTKELDDFYSYIPPSLEELIEEQDSAKSNNGLFRDSLMNKSYESMNLMMFNDPNTNNTQQQDDLIIDTDGDMFAFM